MLTAKLTNGDLSFAVAGMAAIASLTAEIQKSTTADVVMQSW